MTTDVTCLHCARRIVHEGGRWIDPEATGDDAVWRETCDRHDTFTAEHQPREAGLGVGHVWTEVQCPAYRTSDPATCTCRVPAGRVKLQRAAALLEQAASLLALEEVEYSLGLDSDHERYVDEEVTRTDINGVTYTEVVSRPETEEEQEADIKRHRDECEEMRALAVALREMGDQQ